MSSIRGWALTSKSSVFANFLETIEVGGAIALFSVIIVVGAPLWIPAWLIGALYHRLCGDKLQYDTTISTDSL